MRELHGEIIGGIIVCCAHPINKSTIFGVPYTLMMPGVLTIWCALNTLIFTMYRYTAI